MGTDEQVFERGQRVWYHVRKDHKIAATILKRMETKGGLRWRIRCEDGSGRSVSPKYLEPLGE